MITPTDPGIVQFYETVKPHLLEKYGLTLAATQNSFSVYLGQFFVASGDNSQWLVGFIAGLEATAKIARQEECLKDLAKSDEEYKKARNGN